MADFGNEKASQFNILKNPYVDNTQSVSGSDITGVFGHVEFVNLQGVSVSVNREVHPIYVMGKTDPVSFVRGKRGVAGSLVAIATDRGALFDIIERWGVYARSMGDNAEAGQTQQRTQDRLSRDVLDETQYLGYELAVPDYADQLPPFDITLIGRSEGANGTISRIGGVFIVSMGTGISVDDNSIEQQMTFVALFYEDWRPAGRRNWDAGRGNETEEYNPFLQENQGAEITDSTATESTDELGRQFGLQAGDRPGDNEIAGDEGVGGGGLDI